MGSDEYMQRSEYKIQVYACRSHILVQSHEYAYIKCTRVYIIRSYGLIYTALWTLNSFMPYLV